MNLVHKRYIIQLTHFCLFVSDTRKRLRLSLVGQCGTQDRKSSLRNGVKDHNILSFHSLDYNYDSSSPSTPSDMSLSDVSNLLEDDDFNSISCEIGHISLMESEFDFRLPPSVIDYDFQNLLLEEHVHSSSIKTNGKAKGIEDDNLVRDYRYECKADDYRIIDDSMESKADDCRKYELLESRGDYRKDDNCF